MKKNFLFLFIPLLIISCSKTSDQDYFDQGSKYLKENKINEALKSFETLLAEYPNSKIAPKTLVQIAAMYQNNLIKEVKMLESFNKAQEYFMQVYEKYPDSEEAPNSLFMSGYILANNLMKFDDATARFKLFLEKYPSHQLAFSAKQELDNMGLSPEEILKKTETAKSE